MNRFGVREVADVTFKPLKSVDIGGQHFDAFQPVLTLDTAKTSSLEQAVTTVYANGGKGNPTLVSWDGEKKLTLNVQDALMSPVSFSVLSGAGVVKGRTPAGQDKRVSQFMYTALSMLLSKKLALNMSLSFLSLTARAQRLSFLKKLQFIQSF